MSFLVDFDALGDLNIQLCNQSGQFQEALKTFSYSMVELIGSHHMTGKGADNIRDYLSNVHNVITALLGELISTHCSNEMLYFQDYRDTIDSNIHAYIDCAELTKLEEQVQTQKDAALVLDDRLSFALAPIRDIFTVSYRDVTSVDSAHKAAVDYLSTLNENIHALEERHLASDFTNTEKLIQNLRTFIQECRGQSRSYKSSFVPEMLASSASFLALYESHLAIEKEMSEKGPAIEAAIEAENERIAQLQAEYEARKKTAEKQKWLLTGACVLGSIAAIAIIVGSGGTATPLVVGAVSAVSGTVMAGGHALADQYVEHGSLRENAGKYDWGSVFKSAAIGGATGFVTGYLGAGVSQAVTSGLSSTAAGSALLNSTNTFVRVGAGATIGSISQVSSGIVTRGAGTLITSGGDWDAALHDAFNLKSIVFDAAIGGVTGGLRSAKDPEFKLDAEKQRYQDETGWSDDVVEHVDSGEQYDIYKKAELTDGEVNGRSALMKDIDYDYVDEKTGLTNRELMASGRSPYDAKTGERIELHHMGQDYDGPFAKLCENSEHGDGNHSILHPKTENSWRNNADLKYQYQRERMNYWKTRSTGGM